jgi:hypothetical protein
VHGDKMVDLQQVASASMPQADASLSRVAAHVCVVLTADCLPVLFARRDGRGVAAAHAGWRGLAAGVLENTSRALGGEQLAWLGPCIGPQAFEVGPEVRRAFVEQHADATACFEPGAEDRYWADLRALASLRLAALGVAVFAQPDCTYTQAAQYYSHRRDAASGRQASLIWLRN